MTKKALLTIILLTMVLMQGHAVLKEKDLNSTLTILRQELIDKHEELEKRNKYTQMRNERIMKQFRETFHKSNQNSLMLYSQKPDYVFDMTYACHEATNQFQQFARGSAPLRKFMEKNDAEIARYDSLIGLAKYLSSPKMGSPSLRAILLLGPVYLAIVFFLKN